MCILQSVDKLSGIEFDAPNGLFNYSGLSLDAIDLLFPAMLKRLSDDMAESACFHVLWLRWQHPSLLC